MKVRCVSVNQVVDVLFSTVGGQRNKNEFRLCEEDGENSVYSTILDQNLRLYLLFPLPTIHEILQPQKYIFLKYVALTFGGRVKGR
jgi:hypothetical protein